MISRRRFLTHYCTALCLVLLLTGCAVIPIVAVDNPPQTMPLKAVPMLHHPVLAIALGGGATRGFAHVGVLNALQRNGIIPDMVVGTSAGAVVGALYAGGIRGTQLEEAAMQLQRDQIVDWSYSGRGFIRGELLQQYINSSIGNRPIEKLPTLFAATATELATGKLVVFTQGDAGVAVRASSTIPGLVSPVTINGVDYVDGGLVSKVPVRVARQLGADIVIAVNVSRPPTEHEPLDSTFKVMQQALAIMSESVLAQDLPKADVVIQPELGVMSINDFDMRQKAIDAGEKAALGALEKIKALIRQRRQQQR